MEEFKSVLSNIDFCRALIDNSWVLCHGYFIYRVIPMKDIKRESTLENYLF